MKWQSVVRQPNSVMQRQLILAAFALTPAVDLFAQSNFFTVPYNATLYLSPLPSSAGAVTEFGLGTSSNNAVPVFTGLPFNPVPDHEVQIGFVAQGTSLNFFEYTVWGSQSGWACSDDTNSPASRCAFMDTDNSLGWGGSVVQQTSPTTWTLHLDDALSYLADDNDADVLIQVRLVQQRHSQRRSQPS